jgi:LysM repeat protein
MLFWNRWNPLLGAFFLALLLGGCSLPGDGQPDDEKEPHFVLGKSRVNALDYTGAVEAFQEALEVSPRSAAAHYQLAWLYENQLHDPAAAIYHYQEYLDLSPKAGNRDVIRQHIYACKQQLVMDVMQLPSAPAAQQQIEKLAEQNRTLQDELDKWHAYYASELANRPNPASPTPQVYAPAPGQPGSSPTPYDNSAPALPLPVNRSAIPVTSASNHPTAPMPRLRTHTVASGETLAAIARHAGVSLAALESANPGLNPKHLHTGQTVYLPAP